MNRTRPYLNKHTLQKQLQIVDNYHSLNMKLIKPITSKLMEHSDHITINNTKKEKLKETRNIQIERDNKILLNKISAVMNKEGSYSMTKTVNFRTKLNKSLNLTERKKQDRHILEENKRFVQRLQKKKATMDLQKLRKDWCDNKEVMKRMSNRDFYLTTLRSQDNHRYTANYKWGRSKIELSRLSRICVVDGCKMRIKIRFVGGFLKITADCLDNTSAKQISIPKDEAIYFIQSQCHGKLEQLIDKLKYDSANDVLFMVSDSLAEVLDQDLHYYNPQIEKTKQRRFLDMQIKQKRSDKNDKKTKGKQTTGLSSISEQQVTRLRLDLQETLNSPLQLLEEKIQYNPLQKEESELIGFQQDHNRTFNQFLSFESIVSNQILEEEPSNTSKRLEQRIKEILVQPEQMEDYNQIIHVPESMQPAKIKAHSLINDQSAH